MEWTLDQERLYENPLMTPAGRDEIHQLMDRHGVRVLSLTFGLPLSTRETVPIPTPACLATSAIVVIVETVAACSIAAGSQGGFRGGRRRRRLAGVAHVRPTLLVTRTIGELDRPEAVPLVEPPGRPVGLERPQLEVARLTLPDDGHELVAQAATHPRRVDVQVMQPTWFQHELPDDHTIEVGDPHVHRRDGDRGHPLGHFRLGCGQ